jgi:predicted nucleic acid-binding protein
VSVYFDANIVVALFVPDSLTARATSLVSDITDPILLSDITGLEFASTVTRLGRSREITPRDVKAALAEFDAWALTQGRIEVHADDIATADGFVRRQDINLHGADAIHVAMATRAGARLLTLDGKMRTNAKKLGLSVI